MMRGHHLWVLPTEEGEGEEEGSVVDDSEGEESEDDAAHTGSQRGYLWCTQCGRSRHPDDFSDKQRRHGTDEDRFCLKHTGGDL